MADPIAFTGKMYTQGVGYSNSAILTKSDSVIYDPPWQSLWVGGVGDVNVVMANGTTVKFSAVPAGTLLPVSVKQLLSTGTSATLVAGMG